MVSNHIQGVELYVDNLPLIILLQGGAVGGHQHYDYGDEGGCVQDIRGEDRHVVGVVQRRRRWKYLPWERSQMNARRTKP